MIPTIFNISLFDNIAIILCFLIFKSIRLFITFLVNKKEFLVKNTLTLSSDGYIWLDKVAYFDHYHLLSQQAISFQLTSLFGLFIYTVQFSKPSFTISFSLQMRVFQSDILYLIIARALHTAQKFYNLFLCSVFNKNGFRNHSTQLHLCFKCILLKLLWLHSNFPLRTLIFLLHRFVVFRLPFYYLGAFMIGINCFHKIFNWQVHQEKSLNIILYQY